MPLTAADRIEMIDLVWRYNQAIDRRDGPAWADTFTEDGAFQIQGAEPVRGRAALIELIVHLKEPSFSRHWATNFVFEDGDTDDDATMRAYFALLDGDRIRATGRYVNTMRRVDGSWKFAHRLYIGDPRARVSAA